MILGFPPCNHLWENLNSDHVYGAGFLKIANHS